MFCPMLLVAIGALAAGPRNACDGRLQLREAVQDALFCVNPYWVGGPGGSLAVVDNIGNIRTWGGIPLFVDQAKYDELRGLARSPSCVESQAKIVVSARIRLEMSSGTVPLPPLPTSRGSQKSTRPYYRVVIEKFSDVKDISKPCK